MFKVLALCLVLGVAAQANPAGSPKDLQVVLKSAIAIVRIIGDRLLSGIEEAKPYIDDLEAQMNANLAKQVEGLLNRTEHDINVTVERVRALEGVVLAAIDKINAASGSCRTTAEAGLSAVLNSLGGQIATILKNAIDGSDLEDALTSLAALGDQFHASNIAAVNGGANCVDPKRDDIKQCLDSNGDAWVANTSSSLVNGLLLVNEVIASVTQVANVTLSTVLPLANETRWQADDVIAQFANCVQELN